jgi:hypothetical protein
MRFVALRTIPMRIAVFRIFGDMMCLLLRTIPTVRATRGLGVRLFACIAIPIPLRAIGTDGVVSDAGGAPPIMLTVGFFCQNRVAIDTEATAVFAVSVNGKRLLAGRTIPIMIAVNGRYVRLSAICAEPVIIVANGIHGVMERTPGAVPEMFAIFVRREDFIAVGADAITVDIGIRTGMLAFVAGTVPIVFAIDIQGIGIFARFAIPIMIAMDGWHIHLLTGRAEPVITRTGFIHCVMGFANRARPIMLTVLCFCQNRIAFRTIKTSVRANVIQRMPLFAVGAIPEMFARLADINRRLAGRAVPAVRIRSGTDHVRRMVKFTGRTIPVMRTVFSDR